MTVQHIKQSVVWTVLIGATPILAKFLQAVLPQISPTWWDDLINKHLTDEQCKKVIKGNMKSLDLLLLLRVFDRNWFDILSIKDLPQEARSYAETVNKIRNDEAHVTSEPRNLRDVRNDLASIARFSRVIGADESFLENIRDLKDDLELSINDGQKPYEYPPKPDPLPPKPTSTRSKYDPFWIRLKSNIAQLFDEAYKIGISSKIDVSEVRSFGYRPSAGWYGTALVVDDDILDAPMAHAMSLARVSVVEEGLNRRYKGVTFELYVSSKCELHIEKIGEQVDEKLEPVKGERKKPISQSDNANSIRSIDPTLSKISWDIWQKIVAKEPEWIFMEPVTRSYDFGKFACLILVLGLNDYRNSNRAEISYWPPLCKILLKTPVPKNPQQLVGILEPFYSNERNRKQKHKRLKNF